MYILIIKELFKTIGIKFIDPNFEESDQQDPEEKEMERIRKQTVKINTKEDKKEVKGGKCC